MDDKLKEAFDAVRAEDSLKENTKIYIAEAIEKKHKKQRVPAKHLISAAACCIALLLSIYGFGTYFTPVSTISIDINPSIELSLNCFDKVVSVHAFNDDGEALKDTWDVKYMDYTDALDSILNAGSTQVYTDDDAVVSITVVSSQEDSLDMLMEGVQSCTSGQNNVYCYASRLEEVEAAHSAGLSYGKYRAFLELQELDPSVSTDDVQGMSMREIRNLIEDYSDNQENIEPDASNTDSNSKNGQGYGNGQKKGTGQGSGNKQNQENGQSQGNGKRKGQA